MISFHTRRIRWIPKPFVARRNAYVEAGLGRRRTAPTGAIQQRDGLHDVLLWTMVDTTIVQGGRRTLRAPLGHESRRRACRRRATSAGRPGYVKRRRSARRLGASGKANAIVARSPFHEHLPRTSGVEGPNQLVGNQPLSAASCTTITGHGARLTTTFEVLPSSLARTPLRPREPTTIAAASCRRANSTIVLATVLASTVAMGSASSPRDLASWAPSSDTRCAEARRSLSTSSPAEGSTTGVAVASGLGAAAAWARAASHTVTTNVLRDGSSLATAATARRAADEPSYAITVGPSSRLTGGSIIGRGHPAQSEFPLRLAGRRTRRRPPQIQTTRMLTETSRHTRVRRPARRCRTPPTPTRSRRGFATNAPVRSPAGRDPDPPGAVVCLRLRAPRSSRGCRNIAPEPKAWER